MTRSADISVGTFGIAAAVMMIPLVYHASHAITGLHAARSTLRGLHTIDADTSVRREAGLAKAHGRLTRNLRLAALDHGVTLRTAARPGETTTVIGDSVEATGSPPAILAFIDAVETGSRVTRFRKWRIERSSDGVRLTGETVALLRDWR